jgi:hypothetical protein
MASKNKRQTNSIGFPIDDRPVIFNLIDNEEVTFIGRYIESEAMFLISLNDESSDFAPATDVNEWWYIDEHPTIIREVLNNKNPKKSKKKEDKKLKENKDSSNKVSKTEPQTFEAPKLPPLPPFIKDFVREMENRLQTSFHTVNVRMVGEDELDILPVNALEEILSKAESDENWDLAIKVRDCINLKKKNDA